jgi:hypothetical protein
LPIILAVLVNSPKRRSGLDWFNWDHPIVGFLKAETLTLMRARLGEALGEFKQVQPESEFAPTVRSLLTRIETLLNEISADSELIFEIDTINEFLEKVIFQSAGLFPKVELTADDRAARVFRSNHFRRYLPTVLPESLTPEFVANHFRIATACLVNALHDLESLNSGSHPLTEASFVPAIRSVPTEDFILTDPKQRSNHAPDWLIKDAAPERRVEAVQRQIRAINDWLFSLGRTDTNYELLITTERTIVTNVGSSPEEQSLNAAQVRFLGFRDRRNGSVVHLSETGTGFNQLIPVLFASMGGDGPVCIQQPELHLHPALQSELGDLFLKSALDHKRPTNQLIIETHSEQILLRIMRRIRETSRQTLPLHIPPVHPDDVCILYVDPRDEGSIVRTMPLTEDGHLLYDWPGGFFEEGLRELLL